MMDRNTPIANSKIQQALRAALAAAERDDCAAVSAALEAVPVYPAQVAPEDFDAAARDLGAERKLRAAGRI